MRPSIYLIRKLSQKEQDGIRNEFFEAIRHVSFEAFSNEYNHEHSSKLTLRTAVLPRDEEALDAASRWALYGNALGTKPSSKATEFPFLMNLLYHEARTLGGYLARAMITRTENEYRFFPHVDRGYYYVFHKRYHVVIESKGTTLFSGNDSLLVTSGDVFFLNNLKIHSGKQVSGERVRVHVIFDVFQKNIFRTLWRYLTWICVERRIKDAGNMTLAEGLKGFFLFPKIISLLFSYRDEEKRMLTQRANL